MEKASTAYSRGGFVTDQPRTWANPNPTKEFFFTPRRNRIPRPRNGKNPSEKDGESRCAYRSPNAAWIPISAASPRNRRSIGQTGRNGIPLAQQPPNLGRGNRRLLILEDGVGGRECDRAGGLVGGSGTWSGFGRGRPG